MEGFLQNFKDLKIELEEIIKATKNFNQKNILGGGGFGNVYKGEVSHAQGRRMVAIKRLDRRHGQGEAEFMKEIETLSCYKHENIISLLGFCYQGDEAFIVYELASHGSLDQHLKSPLLTWSKRIKICLDAAKGLRHLHDPRGTHQRLIHCDVKGSNILLDDQWNAKFADFGFSIAGPANEVRSTIFTLAAGTPGYIDPLYETTNTLTKESDVYSFGVVLFEVLFGRPCYTHRNGIIQEILVPKWKECYEEKKLNGIIFKDPAIQPLEQSVLEIFSDIAYQCLKEAREDRPDMADVVTELERALSIHELLQNQEFRDKWNAQSFYYKEMAKTAEPPLNYKSEDELKNLLSKGILLNRGKTYFSLNKKGEHCEMISIAHCFDSAIKGTWSTEYNSRFAVGTFWSPDWIFKTHVKTQFLSPGITYAVNLVFKFKKWDKVSKCEHISLKYKLQGETQTSVSHLVFEREDGWWMAELCQFTCDHKIVHLKILFEGLPLNYNIEAEGTEFRPLENVEHKEDDNQLISDSDSDLDANWEEKLPTDYEDIMKLSKSSLQWKSKEEAYSIMSKGFLISVGWKKDIWFSLDKNVKKCLTLSTRAAYIFGLMSDHRLSLPESRFGEALKCDGRGFSIGIQIQSKLVSSETTYAIYLVYKLSDDQSGFEAPIRVENSKDSSGDNHWYIYLIDPPRIPVIKPKADRNTHIPPSKLMKKGLPQQRNDGWMEVQLLEFRTSTTTEIISLSLDFKSTVDNNRKFNGLIIEGIQYRPV